MLCNARTHKQTYLPFHSCALDSSRGIGTTFSRLSTACPRAEGKKCSGSANTWRGGIEGTLDQIPENEKNETE